MTILVPDALPQLHKGAHAPDSGRACVMNAIAYINGDKEISDMPACVYPPFALLAQSINDNYCSHTKCTFCEADEGSHDCVTPLCSPCAHQVWMTGVQLIGTAELATRLTPHERRWVAIEIGAAFIDWDTEQDAMIRSTETDNGIWVGANRWKDTLAGVQAVISQRGPWSLRLSTPFIHNIEQAGGAQLAHMIRLIQAPSPSLRDGCVLQLGKGYAQAKAWASPVGWSTPYGYRKLAEKMTDVVGILRRAAGHAEQADVVLTEEQVAKVPVAVA